MSIMRMQCSFQMDSANPRDVIVINPVFNDTSGGTNAQQLASDLATALDTWAKAHGITTQLTVKAYDAQGSPPVFPQGTSVKNTGSIAAATVPREVAICLSFYSGINYPRRRGRVYVPAALLTAGSNLPGRPSAAYRGFVGDLVPIFTGLGGLDTDWSVYSVRDNTARAVTNWWVDDEWDTVRSRGLRGSTRLTGTTSELSALALEELETLPGFDLQEWEETSTQEQQLLSPLSS